MPSEQDRDEDEDEGAHEAGKSIVNVVESPSVRPCLVHARVMRPRSTSTAGILQPARAVSFSFPGFLW